MPNPVGTTDYFINDFDNDDFDELLLHFATYAKGESYVNLWINSEGGDVKRAFALVELMEIAKRQGTIVSTFVLCDAYSAGSIVAVAGTKGYRWTARNASYMLHYGQAENNVTNSYSSAQLHKANVINFGKVRGHYTKYCNIKGLKGKLDLGDTWLTGADAYKYEMADGFLEDY